MDALKFTLSGKTAFFKQPDVNTYFFFSYGMIHKVALLGMFGAILGYGGYAQQTGGKAEIETYPEFYEKLRNLKIAVIPYKYSFRKKVQTFNNSVGYASREQGGNWVVKEQWIEDPKWDIYVALDCEEAVRLCNALKDRSFVYLPYLGKNDHPADITGVVRCNLGEAVDVCRIDSLFIKGDFELKKSDIFSQEPKDDEALFKYEEKLPVGLEELTNAYMLASSIFTNMKLTKRGGVRVFSDHGRNIVFF